MATNNRKRSDAPFFSSSATRSAVADVASSPSLVLYVGSGVTIDRVGFGWRGLIEKLFDGLDNVEPRIEEYASRDPHPFDEVQLASLVASYYQRQEELPTLLTRRIADLIYGSHSWREGNYAHAIAQLCAVLVSRRISVVVVTTNYDQFLEEVLQRTFDSLEVHRDVRSLDLESASIGNQSDPVIDSSDGAREVFSVIHLHGVVYNPQTKSASKDDSAVLSEADYFATEHTVEGVLKGLFNDHPLLILGSGLNDTPLLRGLAITRTSAHPRWAVLPKAVLAMSPDDWTDEGFAPIRDAVHRRMEQFGVKLIHPDFFSQASQFVREVGLEFSKRIDGGGRPGTDRYDSEGSAYNYTQRLTSWYEAWMAHSRSNPPDAPEKSQREQQRRDFEALRNGLPAIASILGDIHEGLKLELWLRYEPGPQSRSLRLWAASTGAWPDLRLLRTAPIEDGSDLAAVRVFCSGMPELLSTPGNSRWLRYLAVPVYAAGPDTTPATVGVIALATSSPTSRLRDGEALVLKDLVVRLGVIAQPLVFNQPLASAPPRPEAP